MEMSDPELPETLSAVFLQYCKQHIQHAGHLSVHGSITVIADTATTVAFFSKRLENQTSKENTDQRSSAPRVDGNNLTYGTVVQTNPADQVPEENEKTDIKLDEKHSPDRKHSSMTTSSHGNSSTLVREKDKRIDGGGGTSGTNEGSETEEDIISNLLEQESYLPVSLGEIKAEPGRSILPWKGPHSSSASIDSRQSGPSEGSPDNRVQYHRPETQTGKHSSVRPPDLHERKRKLLPPISEGDLNVRASVSDVAVPVSGGHPTGHVPISQWPPGMPGHMSIFSQNPGPLDITFPGLPGHGTNFSTFTPARPALPPSTDQERIPETDPYLNKSSTWENSQDSYSVYKCQICGRCYVDKQKYETHMRYHETLKYECRFCGKVFSKKCSLMRHARNHTGQKPFKCDFCVKSFARSDILAKHVRLHTYSAETQNMQQSSMEAFPIPANPK